MSELQAGPAGTGGATANHYMKLIELGIALSAERDLDRLLEMILLEAKSFCNADGGTLYLMNEEKGTLSFAIMRNDSLDVALGGTTGKDIPFPPLKLYDAETGEPNHNNVATHVALAREMVNIPDAYEAEAFDFSGTRKFDETTGYRSTSFLTVPLMNRGNDVIGVLQLLNAQDRDSSEVIAFAPEIEPLVAALASQAAVALDNRQLMEAQKQLMDSFIELIASAIDAKSPYTGGHCQRVPVLAAMLAEAASDSADNRFAGFQLSDEDRYELHIASWLHDCGKVTTPEYVVDKATKLETIYNRIHEVRMRFEVLKRDATIEYMTGILQQRDTPTNLRKVLEERHRQLDDDFAFVAECNVGGEFMAPDKIERLKRIAEESWERTISDRVGLSHEELRRYESIPEPDLPVQERLLADKPEHIVHRSPEEVVPDAERFNMDVPEYKFNFGEVYNLSISRGTLTEEERYKINHHIVQTIVMLEALPFPKHLKRVPEFAGGHHETMVGTGYPRRLTRDDMSLPARMMAIADIFEALTASDRPYKKAKTLSEAVRILSFMKKDGHIDPDLFELFLTSGIYRHYGEQYLRPEQVDDVDISQYLEQAAE